MITYGNGDPLDMDVCNAIESAKWSAAYVSRSRALLLSTCMCRHLRCACRCIVPLQAGSMLVLDNWAVMHGRLTYKGSRTMVVLLTND